MVQSERFLSYSPDSRSESLHPLARTAMPRSSTTPRGFGRSPAKPPYTRRFYHLRPTWKAGSPEFGASLSGPTIMRPPRQASILLNVSLLHEILWVTLSLNAAPCFC